MNLNALESQRIPDVETLSLNYLPKSISLTVQTPIKVTKSQANST